jgi:DNA-binding response OmpR family regulator
MKLLLVLGSDDNYHIISRYIKPLGFELIWYRHVFKAMDNIDEIDPAAIIISARDFPRHWKILVQFVRGERQKENCPIIVLKRAGFSSEDTAQAFFLGVSGLVDDLFENPEDLSMLQSILSRCLPVYEKRLFQRYLTEPRYRFGFVFVNPDNVIVTGDLKTISAGGLSFVPQDPLLIKNIAPEIKLTECSLRTGNNILSPVCRMIRTGRIASMEFLSFPGQEKQLLDDYLENLPMLSLNE